VLHHDAGHLEAQHLSHEPAELGDHVATGVPEDRRPQLQLGVEGRGRRERLGFGPLEAATADEEHLGDRIGEQRGPPGQGARAGLDDEVQLRDAGAAGPGQGSAQRALGGVLDEDPGRAVPDQRGAGGEGARPEILPDEGPELPGEEGGATLGVDARGVGYDFFLRSP
jgi:hypothetical protein